MESFNRSKVNNHNIPKSYKRGVGSKEEKQPLKVFNVKSYSRTKTETKAKDQQ